MALGDTYASLDELKSYLSLTGQAAVDDEMQDALQTASREIERVCHRQFNKTTVATARVFEPDSDCYVYLDDFHTITDLVIKTDKLGDGTFEQTWTTADYDLKPRNGLSYGAPWPFTKVEQTALLYFPVQYHRGKKRASVEVTAQWGWADVPAPVKQACLLLAAENFQLKNAPLGVAGMGEFGVVRVRNNKMAADKLRRYTRNQVLVG